MIELRSLCVTSGQFALRNISFRIERGSYAVLMGQTGQGKTTILEAICGLRSVTSGLVIIDGYDVTRADPADRQIGYVPQDLALFPTMTVREHLAFAMKLRRAKPALIRERVEEMAELLGLIPLLERSVQGLSGGESQRVALGRALSFHPPVLLLDEPLSALDESTRDEMHSLLKAVQQQTGVTTLHVTHSGYEAKALANRRLVLADGQVRDAAPGILSETAS